MTHFIRIYNDNGPEYINTDQITTISFPNNNGRPWAKIRMTEAHEESWLGAEGEDAAMFESSVISTIDPGNMKGFINISFNGENRYINTKHVSDIKFADNTIGVNADNKYLAFVRLTDNETEIWTNNPGEPLNDFETRVMSTFDPGI